MSDISVLDVVLYGESIGTLTHVGGDRTLFAFNDSYIEDENRPTLSLGFKDAFGELITGFRPTQTKLLPFFSNLLPEGHMRKYLAGQHGIKDVREFHLLWALGADLPGAITVRPLDGETLPQSTDESFDTEKSAEARRENAFRFSLAGVQLKFSAIQEARGGLTIPAKGVDGSWIVKLPSLQFEGVPENEYSMMKLAEMTGINVPPIQLTDVDSVTNLPVDIDALKGKALAIERFDRLPDRGVIHMEDFAQVFGVYPDDKYEKASYRGIAQVLGAETQNADITEFIRRLTFNTLIGNADMHLKNWSLIYPDRRRAALSPAYDFVSTIPYLKDENAALKFSRSKRFSAFTDDELSHLAAKAALPEKMVLDTAKETVESFYEHWQANQKHLPLSKDVIDAIEVHIASLPQWMKR